MGFRPYFWYLIFGLNKLLECNGLDFTGRISNDEIRKAGEKALWVAPTKVKAEAEAPMNSFSTPFWSQKFVAWCRWELGCSFKWNMPNPKYSLKSPLKSPSIWSPALPNDVKPCSHICFVWRMQCTRELGEYADSFGCCGARCISPRATDGYI